MSKKGIFEVLPVPVNEVIKLFSNKAKTTISGGSSVYGFWWMRGEFNPASDRATLRVSRKRCATI